MKLRHLLVAAMIATPVPALAFTDPLSDLFGIFTEARLQPHDNSWKKYRWFPQGPSMSIRASFYGGGPRKYEPNSHTANGERFNQWGLTAAHRSLPFGTRLHVCYRSCTTVRVNDRGPAAWTGRSLDLSRGAATVIGLVGAGSGVVSMKVVR